MYVCFVGFYCPPNTNYATEYPCPRGTFNNLTHRVVEGDCQPCSPGQYCDQTGLSEPTGPCDPGKLNEYELVIYNEICNVPEGYILSIV